MLCSLPTGISRFLGTITVIYVEANALGQIRRGYPWLGRLSRNPASAQSRSLDLATRQGCYSRQTSTSIRRTFGGRVA